MSEWIRVADKSPITWDEFDGHYMTREVIAFGDSTVAQATFAAGDGGGSGHERWRAFDTYGAIPPRMITHWMPLPDPPTE